MNENPTMVDNSCPEWAAGLRTALHQQVQTASATGHRQLCVHGMTDPGLDAMLRHNWGPVARMLRADNYRADIVVADLYDDPDQTPYLLIRW